MYSVQAHGRHAEKHGKERLERHAPPVRYYLSAPIRHYLGGCTRTTQYLWTGYRTASGAWPSYGMVAADPSIPFGALVVIPGLGTFRVADRGGAVWGNHLDLFVWRLSGAIADCYSGVYWLMPYG